MLDHCRQQQNRDRQYKHHVKPLFEIVDHHGMVIMPCGSHRVVSVMFHALMTHHVVGRLSLFIFYRLMLVLHNVVINM